MELWLAADPGFFYGPGQGTRQIIELIAAFCLGRRSQKRGHDSNDRHGARALFRVTYGRQEDNWQFLNSTAFPGISAPSRR